MNASYLKTLLSHQGHHKPCGLSETLVGPLALHSVRNAASPVVVPRQMPSKAHGVNQRFSSLLPHN